MPPIQIKYNNKNYIKCRYLIKNHLKGTYYIDNLQIDKLYQRD